MFEYIVLLFLILATIILLLIYKIWKVFSMKKANFIKIEKSKSIFTEPDCNSPKISQNELKLEEIPSIQMNNEINFDIDNIHSAAVTNQEQSINYNNETNL